jgi:hypothetical protein
VNRRTAALGVLALGCIVAPAPAQDAAAKVLHEQAEPSPEEQLLVELVNRARLDPVGESQRLFADYGSAAVTRNVDAFAAQVPRSWTRAENRDRWATFAPRPALAVDARLMSVSHRYSEAMRARDTVAQSFPGVSGLLSRVSVTGYDPLWLAQLLQGFTGDVLTTHASWAIDWGQPSIGGSRPLTPNRDALMNPNDFDFLQFVEVGVGILKRADPPPGGVGPHVTTMTMGRSYDDTRRFVTGVVFDDRDGDGFYDVGEGMGGVRVDVEPSAFYALTSPSGGYAVPVDGQAGAVSVTASGVTGKASEIFRRQTAEGSTLAFGRPANVKADFVLLPRPAPPAPAVLGGATGAGVADGEAVFDVVVPAIDPEHPTLGDLDVEVDVAHPDRSRLRLALRAPDGEEILLWEGGPGGADLVGWFDTTLRPREDLAQLVDHPYAGTWQLLVADAAGTAPDVRSWRLHVRPRWEGPLHARPPHLFVTKLRVQERDRAQGDRITLKGEVDVGHPLPEDAAGRAVLILRSTEAPHTEIVRVPLAGEPGVSGVLRTGTVSLSVTPSVKETSRARVRVDVKALDLPPLPRDVRLELALGDVLVSEDVRLSKGRFAGKRTAPLGGTLRVDSLRSRPHVLGVRTDLRGRYLQSSLPKAAGVVELRIGGASGLWTDGPVALDGPVAVYGPAGDFTKLVLDTSTGRFRARAVGLHDADGPDGRVPISLWIGKRYEALTVTPRRLGDSELRY